MIKHILHLAFFAALSLSHTSYAQDFFRFPVYGMQEQNLDHAWRLETDEQYSSVVLDCMSFLNELRFYQKNPMSDGEISVGSFFVYHQECHRIAETIFFSMMENTPLCIELSSDPASINISTEMKGCHGP